MIAMSSGGDPGQHWAEQGIDAWAKHGVEELEERDAVDRAERGLASADGAEHYGSGAGSALPVDTESGTIVES